jgi:D-arabinose 5-phosphate isomerase GutQ
MPDLKKMLMRKTARKLKARVEAITQQPASDMAISRDKMILSQGQGKPTKLETTPQIKEMIETLEGVTGSKFENLVVKTDEAGFSFKLSYIKNEMQEEMADRVELEKL